MAALHTILMGTDKLFKILQATEVSWQLLQAVVLNVQ